MKYIYAECLETGEVFATPIKNWRTAIKCLNTRLELKYQTTGLFQATLVNGTFQDDTVNITIADENFKGWRS